MLVITFGDSGFFIVSSFKLYIHFFCIRYLFKVVGPIPDGWSNSQTDNANVTGTGILLSTHAYSCFISFAPIIIV